MQRRPWWNIGYRVALLCGVLLFGASWLQCGPSPRRDNIVLVTLDTTRADRLGCYGSAVAETPALDRLAEEALVFDNAITTVPLTLPAHSSILTGKTPLGHGVRNNGSFQLQPRHETLAELLSQQGYTTAAFVSCYVVSRRFGIAQGFDVYDDRLATQERGAEETTRQALRWLRSGPEEPFFLWVHYFDPHTPWHPPEPFASTTRGTPYDAEISAMDAGLGRLLDALQQHGLYDDAHIIALADHGEGLGDHQEHEHGIFLYEECLRIPWIWKLPGGRDRGRSEALVGVVDLMPTLLDFVGIAGPEGTEGTSLRPLLSHGRAPRRAGLYAETLYPYYSYEWSPLYAWRTPDWKYIEAPQSELYNLTADAGERENRIDDRVQKTAALARELERYRQARGADRAIPAQGDIDPETAQQLLSLGYVSSSVGSRDAPEDSLPDPKTLIGYHEAFELARRAFEEGRYEEAVDGCRTVLSAYPDNHSATMLISQALLKAGRPQEALTWMERHIEAGADPNASITMGRILLALDRPDDARAWLRRQVSGGGPQQAAAHQLIGDALLAQERLEEALDAYERTAASRSTPALAHKRAMVLARLERFDQAAAVFAEGARLSPPDEAGVWQGWIEDARRLADLGVRRPAATDDALRAQVRSAAGLQMQAQARGLLAQAADERARELILQLEGDLALQNQDWQAARSFYAQAEALGAHSQDFYLRYAMASLEQDDPAAAADVLTRATGRLPDAGGLLHYNLACALARAGDPDAAMKALTTAVDRGYANLAQFRADTDLRTLRARQDFRKLVTRLDQDTARD